MIFLIKLCFVCLLIQSLQSTNIHLNSNNRFDDMLVFINDNVDEDGGTLLTRIKDHLNKASKSLWKATSNMHRNKAGVQFGTVYIRLPETWQFNANPITWQQCNKANFYITVDNEGSNQPFTKQLGGCGVPGDFTRFPKVFFRSKSENETFQAGKQIMNEFVKLRYGVFDEKPYRNRLTTFNGRDFIKSACGKDIQWTMNKDKMKCVEPNKDCKYTIVPNQTHNYSVMFDTTTHSSEFFCDEKSNQHNKYAISLQNRICKQQSITKVILRHQDFKLEKIKLPFENVNFVIVKGTSRRMALVLDVSSSMSGIIENMKKAAAEFVSQVENSALLGIVIFSTLADIKSGLVSMEQKQNRDNLINIINALQHNGMTNIPDGLAKGVQVLGGDISSDAKMFGSITLLTDGQNNQNSPFGYDYVISQLIKKGILVNAIAYGTSADANLDKLTKGTDGKYFYSDTSKPYIDLLGKFSVRQSCDIQISESLVNEGNITLDLIGKIHQENLTFIDKYLGVNVKFTLTVPRAKAHYKATLIDPKGKRINWTDRFEQTSGVTLTFVIPGRPETGMYKIEFVSPTRLRFRRNTDFLTISFTVSAAQEPNSTRIIKPTGALSDSQIEMLSDSSTIQATVDLTTCGILKEENITVILIMDAPYQNNIRMTMLDDGMGDDSVEDDKIFTKLLLPTNLKDIGFYNFRANVKIFNNKTKEIIERSVQLGSLRVKDKQQAPIVDKIPPAKIEFVKIDIISSKRRELKVEITAPGNDGMNGNISNYEIMVKFNGTEHIENQTANSQPKESIKFDVYLSKLNVTNPFEISVRGIDDKLNYGEWSLPQIYNWEYEKIVETFKVYRKCGTANLVSFWIIFLCVQFVFRY